LTKDLVRFTTAGSVDDGKSTLIGRLLYDMRGVYEDQLESLRKASRNGLDLAYLTDGLRAEREQGITIDVAYRYFETPRRKFIIADTPGHEQYTRNIATGASTADLALILIDARNGVQPQSRRHAYIAALMGIRHFVIAVNKMDLVGFRSDIYTRIRDEFSGVLNRLGAEQPFFLPVSAVEGENVVSASARMPWFTGPSLLEYLETVKIATWPEAPLRFPVQLVLRPNQDFRGYAGRAVSGCLRSGMDVVVLPSGVRSRVAEVRDHSVVRLSEQIDVSRGDMLADPDAPPAVTRAFVADLVWMSDAPLRPDAIYLLKHTTRQVCAQIRAVHGVLDVQSLGRSLENGSVHLNDIARVEIETHQPVCLDRYVENRITGSFILIDMISNGTVAAGMVCETIAPRDRVQTRDNAANAGLTVWFTGLSASGKSTICEGVRERLAARGLKTEVLDGDVVRKHLSRGLGYTREDRDENIRRIGFVAGLLTRNGVVALVAAISPYRAAREEVRANVDSFLEVYVNAPLSLCESRDRKDLYRRARAGEIPSFTGVSDPYEPPIAPEVECCTDRETVAESVNKVMEAVDRALAERRPGGRV
jgi:bifunctional enzyme CysN/CysC